MDRKEIEKLSQEDLEKRKLIEEIRELGRPVFLRPGVLLGLATAIAAVYGVFWQFGTYDLRKREAEVTANLARLDARDA